MTKSFQLLCVSSLLFIFCGNNFAQQKRTISLNWLSCAQTALPIFGEPQINSTSSAVFTLDISTILPQLQGISYREGRLVGFVGEIQLPYPDGSFHTFSIKRNKTMHPDYNAKFPQIMTLDGYAVDGSGAFAKWDVTPQGFHAMIMIPGKSTVFIDPMFKNNTQLYIVYHRKDFVTNKVKVCDVVEEEGKPNSNVKSIFGTCELRTYRLALSNTAEYTTFHGGTVVLAAAAQVTSMNRVNGVYEKDIAITMTIIPNNNLLIHTNAATDPFTNGNAGSMINQNQTSVDNLIGSANYDIGHVFGTNSGGLAGLGVVCTGGQKARGVTGSGAPIGDPFDIDYVAHEMGHQFGGNHTQNNPCNSVNAARREPGSASTIMGYAGICAPNVQNNSDDYFHGYNLGEISIEILSNGHQCEVLTALNNTAPTIQSTSGNIVVPISTPFILTGNAIDAEGDVLTYLWEQMDNEASTQPPVATAVGGPNFRSFNPSTDSSRYFPKLSTLASNGPFTWEVLPSVARVMDFRLSVRDNHAVGACNDYTDLTVTTNATAGPFVVTYPSASGITWPGGSSQTVTWSVANTTAAPINCSTVRILLSLNGGQTYPYVLSASTANDGSEVIVCPNVVSNTARIMVMSGAQTFFDISNNNFSITCNGQDVPIFTSISPVCQNDSNFVLPTSSDNGIAGTWLPALNLSNVGSSNYNFTPVATACASVTSFSLTVEAIQQPIFDPFTAVCQNEIFVLPVVSQNNISGTWSPLVDTQVPGNFTYSFTPDAGLCATDTAQILTVSPIPTVAVSTSGITLTALQIGADYQWIDCIANVSIPGATNQSFTTTEISGTYAVIVSLGQCADTSDCFTVDQSDLSEVTIHLVIQPNPTAESVTISWQGDMEELILTDASGKTLRRITVAGLSQLSINLKEFAAGIYYMDAYQLKGRQCYKLIKL